MSNSIYITQVIYIREGSELVFDQFEEIAIPAISRYNGKLLFRIRPGLSSMVECHIERPYEVHLVEFNSEQDFENFKKDEERRKFMHLKEQSIRSSMLIQGTMI